MPDIASDSFDLEMIHVGDILSFSQKFHRRGGITPPDEKWEVIERGDDSFTIKSRFDGQICVIKVDPWKAKQKKDSK